MSDSLRRLLIIGLQAVLAIASALAALSLRFEFMVPEREWTWILPYLGIGLSIKLIAFHYFSLNHGWWKYASINDALAIFKALIISHLILAVVNIAFELNFSYSVMAIDFIVSLLALSGARMTKRFIYENSASKTNRRRKTDKRVLIVGAGDCGVNLARQIKTSERSNVTLVGFVDDAERKFGVQFLGLPVLGKIAKIPKLCKRHRIQEVFISIPSLKKSQLKQIVDLCLEAGVTSKIVPSTYDIIQSGARIDQLRQVSVEDLLGREPVHLNADIIRNRIKGKTVLVTGAGGSIGSELCRQIATHRPKQLILFERSEYNLFTILNELNEKGFASIVQGIAGDVVDLQGTIDIFQKFQPQIVFHAAAHKHVNIMEASPREAIRNNVFGTQNAARAALECQAETFILVSTDKAVKPLSIMGFSKRLAELITQMMSRSSTKTKFVAVRFGNVLGSSGSVVETFRRQLAEGQPLTITSKEATRFFMTIPEAAELLLHAGLRGENGQIYMLDMGQPVRILDLANKMIQLSDPSGRQENQIIEVGLRPGEKLAEELYWEGEESAPSDIENVFRLRTNADLSALPGMLESMKMNLDSQTSSHGAILKAIVDAIDRAGDRSRASEAKEPIARGLSY